MRGDDVNAKAALRSYLKLPQRGADLTVRRRGPPCCDRTGGEDREKHPGRKLPPIDHSHSIVPGGFEV